MTPSHLRRAATAALAVGLAMFALAVQASPSNKWRIVFDGSTGDAGSVSFRISPVGAEPIEVETAVPAKTTENSVARLVRDALRLKLGKGYKIETDDGEDVLIKKKGKTPDFELALANSSLTGLEVKIKRE